MCTIDGGSSTLSLSKPSTIVTNTPSMRWLVVIAVVVAAVISGGKWW